METVFWRQQDPGEEEVDWPNVAGINIKMEKNLTIVVVALYWPSVMTCLIQTVDIRCS